MLGNRPDPTPAETEIKSRIADRGRISFREFMEVALYHPSGGYYSMPPAGRQKGRPPDGDYFTSPSAHPAFAAAICVQLAAMWQILGKPSPFTVAEMGAGPGALMAGDVREYADRLDAPFAAALNYLPIDIDGKCPPVPVGCVISNELLDAFPVARFEVVDGLPMEVFVTAHSGGAGDAGGTGLAAVLGEPVTPGVTDIVDSPVWPLADGFRGEVNPGIGPWLDDVSGSLGRGFVVTIDYGGTAGEIYSSKRDRGTLQTYYRHVDGLSPYQNVGAQDITAHVDFTAVTEAGLRVGLRSLGLFSQAEFLDRNGIARLAAMLEGIGMSPREQRENNYGLHQLTRPDGLGGFRVLIQEKGTGIESADRLWPTDGLLRRLPPPAALGDGHLRLLGGSYWGSASVSESSVLLESLWPDPDDGPE